MVGKYIILADCSVGFETPRQLTEINGEPLLKRTIRLLKENGVENIIITSHDKRFDDLGAIRYEPLHNDYVPNKSGYWLNAFPIELINEPICFLFGDVYYSENAIKIIVESKTNSVLFLCSYQNKDKRYIKEHDEPLAFKVVDYELFKKHIDIVKNMKDKGLCCREPITWELYRSINGQDINVHEMTGNYIAINDESCDIDTIDDIENLKRKLGEIEMIKVEALQEFTLARFNEIENIERARRSEVGKLFTGDKFECEKELCDYLLGANPLGKAVVKVIEVIPAKVEIKEESKEEKEIDITENEFEIRSEEVKELVDEKIQEVEEIKEKQPKPKKKKTSKK